MISSAVAGSRFCQNTGTATTDAAARRNVKVALVSSHTS